MPAIELYKKLEDGTMKACGIFYCSECRLVYNTEDEANWCHGNHLCACGNKVTQSYRRICDECQSKEWREQESNRETERFEKATKIHESEYRGDHVYDNDQFYDCVEDAIDGYAKGQKPEYVWACKEVSLPRADLEDVTSNLLDSMWEDADTSDLNGVEELESALEAFNKDNESIQMWNVDYSTAILVEKETK